MKIVKWGFLGFLVIYVIQICCFLRYEFFPIMSHRWTLGVEIVQLDVHLQKDPFELVPMLGLVSFIAKQGVFAQYSFRDSILQKSYESEVDIPVDKYVIFEDGRSIGLRETDGQWTDNVVVWDLKTGVPSRETLEYYVPLTRRGR